MTPKSRMARSPFFSPIVGLRRSFGEFFRFRPVAWSGGMADYRRDLADYRALGADGPVLSAPCLTDAGETNPVDPARFVAAAWCARKVFEAVPRAHVDAGSDALAMGTIAQGIPVTYVDAREFPIGVPGFAHVEGSVTALPFETGSVESLSALDVVGHAGLGRYGDELDPSAAEKALAELSRVLSEDGNLYATFAVEEADRVYFNEGRTYAPATLEILFARAGLAVRERMFLSDAGLSEDWTPEAGDATAFYHLVRAPEPTKGAIPRIESADDTAMPESSVATSDE